MGVEALEAMALADASVHLFGLQSVHSRLVSTVKTLIVLKVHYAMTGQQLCFICFHGSQLNPTSAYLILEIQVQITYSSSCRINVWMSCNLPSDLILTIRKSSSWQRQFSSDSAMS
jgi:hypothetical protein